MALQVNVEPWETMDTTESRINYIVLKYFASNNFNDVNAFWTDEQDEFRKKHYLEICKRYFNMMSNVNV